MKKFLNNVLNKLTNKKVKSLMSNRRFQIIGALILSCLIFGWLGLVVFAISTLMLVDEIRVKNLENKINELQEKQERQKKQEKQEKQEKKEDKKVYNISRHSNIKTMSESVKTNPSSK